MLHNTIFLFLPIFSFHLSIKKVSFTRYGEDVPYPTIIEFSAQLIEIRKKRKAPGARTTV